MALTQAEKDALVNSGKMAQYSGKSWDEVEKILNSKSSSSNTTSNNTQSTALGTNDNGWYLQPNGKGGFKRLNPNYFDEYGNRLTGNNSSNKNNSGNSSSSSTDMINSLSQAKLNSQLEALKKSRNSQYSALDREKSTIKPMYQQAGLQARGQSGQSARNFAEYLASKGLSSSGVAAQGEINRMGALQGTLGNLGQQETQALSDIESRRSAVDSAYSNDVAGAKAGTAAETMQALISQQRYDQERGDRLRSEEAANELERLRYTDTQNKLEQQNYANTVGRFSNNYMDEINKVRNDGDPTNDYQIAILENARNQKIEGAQSQYQQQGYVSEDIAAALGQPVGAMTDAYRQQQAASQAKTQEAQQKEQVNNAIQMFGQIGYLTPEMKKILAAYGLPTDAVTLQRLQTQYSTNKPYFKPDSNNSGFGLNW